GLRGDEHAPARRRARARWAADHPASDLARRSADAGDASVLRDHDAVGPRVPRARLRLRLGPVAGDVRPVGRRPLAPPRTWGRGTIGSMKVLALNTGSSSIKFQVLQSGGAGDPRRLAQGTIERIGQGATLRFEAEGRPPLRATESVGDHAAGV